MTEHTSLTYTTPPMYIPATDLGDDDDDDDEMSYLSIIPDRSQAVREKWKYAFRRTCFYVFLGTVFGGTISFPFLITNLTVWFWIIYLLYFELDVTASKNAVSLYLTLHLSLFLTLLFLHLHILN